ncbi:hypothetical protein DKX38_011433 [Salix brachista]|uniref:Thioredoxin domain-containing protein n=1 Tax=Salix brachista TaxID=2182728 RepID=A0A5N5LZ17_9ROSI|nr:hypothetical protein DKX38_011433 [Salix brachista]
MDKIILSSTSTPLSTSSLPPLRSAASTASLSSPKKLVLLRSTRIQRKLSSSSRTSTSFCKVHRSTTITCGAITEINESDFQNVVLNSDRPVLVEFVATWCGPCRLISPAMESVAQEYGDRLTVVKIDHDASPKLIEEYKVYGLPALVLFKDGKEVPESRREGAITKAKLKEYVDALLESISVA